MTTVILICTVLGALGYALYVGRAWAKSKADLRHARNMGHAKDRVIDALKEVHKNEAHLRETLETVTTSNDPVELTELYKKILGMS